MISKLRIDPKIHEHLTKCYTCRNEFKNGDTIYKYNHIYDIFDPYEECSHNEEEVIFCSEKCLLEYILQTSNLEILEVELYDESKEISHRNSEIEELLSNMKPDTMAKYRNLRIYCFNRMGKLNYIINNSIEEKLCNSIDDAISKIIYLIDKEN